jgi:hypothetical protein
LIVNGVGTLQTGAAGGGRVGFPIAIVTMLLPNKCVDRLRDSTA